MQQKVVLFYNTLSHSRQYHQKLDQNITSNASAVPLKRPLANLQPSGTPSPKLALVLVPPRIACALLIQGVVFHASCGKGVLAFSKSFQFCD